MKIPSSELADAIIDILKANLVPFITSSPGCGKSDIVHAVAKEFKLFLIDLRLASKDPTDISGFPTLNMDRSRSQYSPPVYFPIEGDSIPKGYDGFLLFLDEMNSASNAVQAASYQVVLDRQVGQHKLHPKCKVIAAGNKMSDKAITNRLSTAMQSRLVHLELDINLDAWINWAYKNEIDYRIISFIKFRPELLHKFDPKHSDNTFASPRTWHFLSKIIHTWPTIPNHKMPILAGTVGEGAAYEFKGFVEIMESLPTFDKMLSNPTTISIPDDPSTLYAMAGLIAHRATEDNIEALMKLINRFPLEFQIICLQDTFKHDTDIAKHKVAQEWIRKNAKSLMTEE